MPKERKRLVQKWLSFAKFLVKAVSGSLILGIISVVIVGRVTDWWRGPESYKIYVVGNNEEKFIEEIKKAFSENIGSNLEIDGVEVEVKDRDYKDKGDGFRAEDISSDLAEARDTLMVVGHFLSTQTEKALPHYMEAEPPIPVILTTETNPHLLPSKGSENGYYPVFRLSPTDDAQARNAAEYAISKGATVFWIVEDTSNRVYSNYLALKFIEKVQEEGKAVVLWSTNLSIPSMQTFKALRINCIFFAGKWSNALILTRQIKAISSGGEMPMIILSDWSADQRLIEQGKDDVQGVYLAHPMEANQYKNHGYKLYGKDASKIVEELIKDASDKDKFSSKIEKWGRLSYWLKRLLNMHRVTDARYVLNSIMEDAVREDRGFEGTLDEEYVFGPEGTSKTAQFHVWQVKDGEFAEAPP